MSFFEYLCYILLWGYVLFGFMCLSRIIVFRRNPETRNTELPTIGMDL